MIKKAFKPYNIIRYLDERIENEKDPDFDITNKRCKWFYEKIKCQKAVKNKAINQWSRQFELDCDCKDFYMNKIKPILEIKYQNSTISYSPIYWQQ